MKRLIAAAALVLPGLVAVAAPSAAQSECEDPADIPILVDYGPLEAEQQVVCAEGAAQMSALAAITGAGVDLEGTTEYGDSVVCRVEGRPGADVESCDSMPAGDSFWGFYIGSDGAWEFAQQGVDQQILEEGEFVALAYGDGTAAPATAPDEELRQQAREAGVESTPADDAAAEDAEDEASDVGLIAGSIVVLVVVMAAIVVVLRRRRS
ncbi:hypothetical protein BHE97_11335 [Aeromicrobium sp. PE09-221]|uniref:hypothetical protein n=1 Tax=Aeromicrobium sp. PE09-221 TaxID=1898043 RepID=UPI000B3E5B5C|nr:hypothetical protein [Aeromicrobium sp. PE09-221]OUZ09304.1 hypothetical protein BHE97_11335 [Aeromicrobium sp. PE09-221]